MNTTIYQSNRNTLFCFDFNKNIPLFISLSDEITLFQEIDSFEIKIFGDKRCYFAYKSGLNIFDHIIKSNISIENIEQSKLIDLLNIRNYLTLHEAITIIDKLPELEKKQANIHLELDLMYEGFFSKR